MELWTGSFLVGYRGYGLLTHLPLGLYLGASSYLHWLFRKCKSPDLKWHKDSPSLYTRGRWHLPFLWSTVVSLYVHDYVTPLRRFLSSQFLTLRRDSLEFYSSRNVGLGVFLLFSISCLKVSNFGNLDSSHLKMKDTDSWLQCGTRQHHNRVVQRDAYIIRFLTTVGRSNHPPPVLRLRGVTL